MPHHDFAVVVASARAFFRLEQLLFRRLLGDMALVDHGYEAARRRVWIKALESNLCLYLPNLPATVADLSPEEQRALNTALAPLRPRMAAFVRAYLTNASLPAAVLDILLGDVLNRPNSLKLPALLDVARTPQHPKAGEAKDFLELFLEEDYASDWDKWQAKMEEWLKANPD